MAIPSILQRILQRKSEEVAAGKSITPLAELAAQARECPAPRGFENALRAAMPTGAAIIAEVKKARSA